MEEVNDAPPQLWEPKIEQKLSAICVLEQVCLHFLSDLVGFNYVSTIFKHGRILLIFNDIQWRFFKDVEVHAFGKAF